MTKRTAFLLMDQERKVLIEEHLFYMEQAKKRLLSQFENIAEEVKQAEEAAWGDVEAYLNEGFYDMGDFADAVAEHGMELSQLLCEMRERTRLSVIAGMYHHWDKRWRRFLARELRLTVVIGDHTRRSVFGLDAQQLEMLLLALGLDVRAFPEFEQLNAMRLIVNVYKHGEGKAMDDLRRCYPQFVLTDGIYGPRFPDDSDLAISDRNVDEFATAIESFWLALPSELVIDIDQDLDVPDRFLKAYTSDLREVKN